MSAGPVWTRRLADAAIGSDPAAGGVYSTGYFDGQRLYYSSVRNDRENIYSLELATGELRQYTNVVTGAFMPTLLREPSTRNR